MRRLNRISVFAFDIAWKVVYVVLMSLVAIVASVVMYHIYSQFEPSWGLRKALWMGVGSIVVIGVGGFLMI